MNDVNRMHSANQKDHSVYGLNTVIRPAEIVVQCCASVLRRAPCPKLAHLFALANLASSNAFALAPSARLHLLVGLATTQRLPINSKACLPSHRSLLVNYLPLAPVSLTSSLTPQRSRPEGVQPSHSGVTAIDVDLKAITLFTRQTHAPNSSGIREKVTHGGEQRYIGIGT
jgi:hypothetical protein